MKPRTFATLLLTLVIAESATPASSAQGPGTVDRTTPSQSATIAAGPSNVITATPLDLAQGIYIAGIDVEDRSLRRYAGQKLYNSEGAELGTIKDFVVDPSSSGLRYLVVSSGGIL